ncbi:hypothetical protein HYX70_04615 [Candidatus Saccharibacteria bacterium]|nr:hypothetical protein [Candidatus Saccharibacteria bacterium]
MADVDYATKKDLKTTERNLETSLDKLDEKINQRFDDTTGLIRELIEEFSGRFDNVEQRLDRLEKNYGQPLLTMDKFIARLDREELENSSRDAQLARLEAWAIKVSKKTGIKLEY